MTRQFCDLCGTDVTDQKSAAISGIPDADDEGNGVIKHHFDACVACYRVWLAWMKSQPAMKKKRRRT